MRNGQADSAGTQREWLLKRNCALTPGQVAVCFACAGCFSLSIAAVFAINGAWMVLPFAIIESLGLLAAFVWFGRHAADYERILAANGRLIVETSVGPSFSRREKASPWFRVEYDGRPRELISVSAGKDRLQIGRFVPSEQRGRLAREIRTALGGVAS